MQITGADLNINEFIGERKGEWERLEAIAGKFRPGRSGELSRDELWELAGLYNGAVSDLAVLKSSELAVDTESHVIAYLNDLVIRVHGIIYRKPPFRWSSLASFFTATFPRTFVRMLPYIMVSAGLFISLGVVGFLLGLAEPNFISLVVPPHIIKTVERGQVWFKDLHTVAPMASSGLMTHNISVTFLMVAAGITFGIGTVYLLALNGLLIGTVAALCFKHDLSIEFWSFVLPHGSLELTALFIAGGAGLVLGHALIDPGRYRRSEYLAEQSRYVGILALGCVPLLVLAGLIEAFFSPSGLPPWLKFSFACVSFSSFMAYVLLCGRGTDHGEDASDSEA